MHNKLLFRSILFVSIFLPMGAYSLTQLGNGDLFLESQLDLTYDSNLFLNSEDEEDDFIGVLFVGSSFVQRDRSVLNVSLDLGMEMTQMMDFTEENAEDFKSEFIVSYPNNIERKSYYELSGGFNEATQANADSGRRIEVDTVDFHGLVTQRITDKFSLEFAADTTDTDYRDISVLGGAVALDRTSGLNEFSIQGAYRYSDRLFGTAGVQYRDLSYQQAFTAEQSGTIFSLGARGQLLPKVSGNISIGIQEFSLNSPVSGKSNNADPFYSLDLIWRPRDKTSLRLSGSSDFASSSIGNVNNKKDVSVRLSERLSDKASINASVGYSINDYEGFFTRTDNAYIFSAGYSYKLTRQSSFDFLVRYLSRESKTIGEGASDRSFDRSTVSFGITSVW